MNIAHAIDKAIFSRYFQIVLERTDQYYQKGEIKSGNDSPERVKIQMDKISEGMSLFKFISNTRRDLPDVISTLKYLKKVAKEFDKVNTETRVATDRTFWNDFEKLAKSFGVGTIGYTHIEPKYIFKGFSVFYQSVIILGMEMKFEKIQKSPQREAGEEAMRIYSELGKANYELAKYMREQGVNAQSIHPFLGPALYPVLARKAGMGEIGANGLLITPQFGPCQRLAIITYDGDLPEKEKTINRQAQVSDYCKKCGQCVHGCPQGAILERPIVTERSVTHIDNKKCMPYFYKTYGCSICIKVCPLIQGGWEKIGSSNGKGKCI
jgi:epoxyqueuosine reductase QueG